MSDFGSLAAFGASEVFFERVVFILLKTYVPVYKFAEPIYLKDSTSGFQLQLDLYVCD